MKKLIAAGLVALALFSQTLLANELGLMVNIKVAKSSPQKNGASNSTSTEFSIWTHFGKEASFENPNTMKISLLATDAGDKTNINLGIYEFQGKDMKLVGEPKLKAVLNQEAAVEWVNDKGEKYILTLTPSKTERPKQS